MKLVLDADDEVKSAEGEAEDELQLRHESAEHPHANGQTDLLIKLSLLQKVRVHMRVPYVLHAFYFPGPHAVHRLHCGGRD